MTVEFKRIEQPTSPVSYRWHYLVAGQMLGSYTLTELKVLRDAAASDLKKSEDWMPDDILHMLREYLAAINKALANAGA